MNKMTYGEFIDAMTEHFKNNKETTLYGVIVIKESSFSEKYSLEERSYRTNSQQKYFNPSMLGTSMYGNCLDGKDLGVRLDWYINDTWEVDYCYLESSK